MKVQFTVIWIYSDSLKQSHIRDTLADIDSGDSFLYPFKTKLHISPENCRIEMFIKRKSLLFFFSSSVLPLLLTVWLKYSSQSGCCCFPCLTAGRHGQWQSDPKRRGGAAGEGEWSVHSRTASSRRVDVSATRRNVPPLPSGVRCSLHGDKRQDGSQRGAGLHRRGKVSHQQFDTRGAIVWFMHYANGILNDFTCWINSPH